MKDIDKTVSHFVLVDFENFPKHNEVFLVFGRNLLYLSLINFCDE